MITPINGHLIVDPLPRPSFMESQQNKYEEKGRVVDAGENNGIETGNIVYFDSWLATKYPKNEQEYFWLVKFEDIRAVEHEEIPEQHVS